MTTQFDISNLQSGKSDEIDVGEVIGARELRGLKLRYWLYKGDTETQRKAAQLVEQEELRQLIDYGVEELCRVVAEWNLVIDGEPILLEPDVVAARVPANLQEMIGAAIRKHRTPGELRGKRR